MSDIVDELAKIKAAEAEAQRIVSASEKKAQKIIESAEEELAILKQKVESERDQLKKEITSSYSKAADMMFLKLDRDYTSKLKAIENIDIKSAVSGISSEFYRRFGEDGVVASS